MIKTLGKKLLDLDLEFLKSACKSNLQLITPHPPLPFCAHVQMRLMAQILHVHVPQTYVALKQNKNTRLVVFTMY